MSILTRTARTLALLATLILAVSPLYAQDPWDAPAFSTDPKALVAAASQVAAGDSPVVILLDEAEYTYDAEGRSQTVYRSMYRIVAESAVQRWGVISATWAPWVDERPTLEARVVTADGSVHMLDAKAVVEAPTREASLDIFSDNRVVRAPLPAVGVGSVVEWRITMKGNSPIAGAGRAERFRFGATIPVRRARMIIDTPAALVPRVVNKTAFEPRVTEQDGRRREVYESGRLEPVKDLEGDLPFDVTQFPYVAFSTGTSWQNIAARYHEIVEKQIAGSDLKKLVRDTVGKTTDKREIVARLLAAIQKNVRYAGVEVGDGSIVPRPPKTVLANKYGDCKDKATLLVAMLREAGITAHVALLRAGNDFDVIADLPGLGRFNHAIVVVDGEPAIWVDPTDEFARAAELPVLDQGRMALVAAPATTALVRTPELAPAANVYTETRTITLPEDGKGRVVEKTSAIGPQDASQRRSWATNDRESYRKSLESYVKSHYVAKALEKAEATDPHDLTKPFVLTLEASEAATTLIRDGDGAVGIHPSTLISTFPRILREYKEPKAGQPADDSTKKRVHEFLFPEPKISEWTYRIVPPAGYAPRTLPENETRKLGTMTYETKFSTDIAGVVVVKMRLDSGKRRISAAEFEETRKELTKLNESDRLIVGFEQVGQTKLNAGDVAGALAEFRRLAELHPKEAQHHIELARALLAGGIGEAAREEARRAVAIEPSNARAHEMLSLTLRHDLLGRLFREGFDLPGAIAEMQKVKELDPAKVEYRNVLAQLYTYGEDGLQHGRNARIADAVAEYRQMQKDLPAESKQYEPALMVLLGHLGKFTEMREVARKIEDETQRNLGRVITAAAIDGAPAALRELGAFDVAKRREYATGAAQFLISVRRYPEAVALLDMAAQGSADPQLRQTIDLFRRMKRIDGLPPADSPRGVVTRLMYGVISGEMKAVLDVLEPGYREEADDDSSALLAMRQQPGLDGFPPIVSAELALAGMELQQDGNDATGYRVRMRAVANTDQVPLTAFVDRTKDGGYYVYPADNTEHFALGEVIIRFAEAGNLEKARTWLNWVREIMPAGGGDDPLGGPAFAALWPRGKESATADEIRLAGATLISHKKFAGKGIAVLEEMRGKATDDATKTQIDLALGGLYSTTRAWAKVLPVSERLYAAHPNSASAFFLHSSALTFSKKYAEAEKLAKARMDRLKDRDSLRMLAQNASQAGKYREAEEYAQRIIDEFTPGRTDYNNAAWYSLFTGSLERGLENARRATGGEKEHPDASALNTLAALYAEAGDTAAARNALLRSMDARLENEPDEADWYVIGRIAESYGVHDAALAAYKRVEVKETGDEDLMVLTERRMNALAKKGR